MYDILLVQYYVLSFSRIICCFITELFIASVNVSLALCVQVIMSSPLLWLVAQTPKECLCMHVVYGMVGNVRVPIIWLVIG